MLTTNYRDVHNNNKDGTVENPSVIDDFPSYQPPFTGNVHGFSRLISRGYSSVNRVGCSQSNARLRI